jgi:ribonucleoside-diphosphate reductase alpha chain
MINNWIENVDYPSWMTMEGLKTLQRQHLQSNESPRQMYQRIVDTLSNRLNTYYKDNLDYIKNKWYEYLWKGWLCPATPILSNLGTKKGFNISCFVERVDDSIDGIYQKLHEMAMLTKYGGGCGITFDKIRGKHEPISNGGFSEGIIPFIKAYDSGILAASQGSTRRGAASINLPIGHKDIEEFINIRRPSGDVNRQCLNINHCVTIDDYFMKSLLEGDESNRALWSKVITTRMETGQPYIMYYHNVHNQRTNDMVKRDLKINGTNICTEILNFHDKDHTVVCCISSINASKYNEWKEDKEFLELCYLFLDTNLSEFIENAKGKKGFEAAVNFSIKSRAIGLGILGWHTLLQQNMIPFNSLQARNYIRIIGQRLKDESDKYNQKWGAILGNPEWCDNHRNNVTRAIAPTTTNSLISGGVSQGIEPIVANVFIQKSAKGTFIRINDSFEKLIQSKYSDKINDNFWLEIGTTYKGSVQHLDFLTNDEKEVFLTAYEINQLELIKSAAIWQKYIDQGISLNLFFPQDVDAKWLNKCHITAWEEGIKTLYYVRTESIISNDMKPSTFSDCLYCE